MSGFADHFSAMAARYAAYRPSYPRELVDGLADACVARDVAWDVGCGSGQLSIGLAARFARVIATDPSQAQLDAAPRHDRIDYACSPAESSGLAATSADLVVSAQAAHWFEWPRFVAEATRVARPGAVLALVSYGLLAIDGDIGAAVQRYHDEVSPYWPPGRAHVDNRYRDLAWPWPELPLLDMPTEMTASWTRDEVFGYVTTWSAGQRHAAAHGTSRLEALDAELARLWPDAQAPRTVRWPLVVKATWREDS